MITCANSIFCTLAFVSRFLNRPIVSLSGTSSGDDIHYKNLKTLGCLLLALLFAYLIDCTNFAANTAVALVPCHTAYFLALLCSSVVLLSLTTRPTVRFGLSDLVILFSLFFSVPASRLARLALFVLSYLYLIISPSAFLFLLCGFAL